MSELGIGGIANYYGGLMVKEDGGKYFWSITDWDGDWWEEIPEYLYLTLIKYNTEYSEVNVSQEES